MFVTGVVLAAEGSPQLGVPRQLLAYRGGTLLGAVLDSARDCGFDQLVVTLGVAAEQIEERVDLGGIRIVHSPHADTGSASIVPALDAVDRRTDGVVVLLGEQPGVTPGAVWSLVAAAAGPATPIAISRYADGRGAPCWFGREVFGDLRALRTDGELWDLAGSGRHPVTEVDALGNMPVRVESWPDYQALTGVYEAGHGTASTRRLHRRAHQ